MAPRITAQDLDRLLAAVVDVGSGLELGPTLRRIVEAATTLAGARYGALGVLDPAGDGLEDFITVGVTDEERARIGELPKGHGLLGVIITKAEPVRIDDLTRHEDRYGFPPEHPPMRSFLGVPIRVRNRVFGNLYLTEKQDEDGERTVGFTEQDERFVVALAATAAVAIENSRLHQRINRLALADDRSRIARDLHDTVIQRIFATGLSLQGVHAMLAVDPDAAGERLARAVDDLDLTVKHIRSVIFGLQAADRSGTSFRDQVLALAQDAVGALGFRPRVTFSGPVDTLVTARDAGEVEVVDDALAVIQESMTNAARHAGCTELAVSVTVGDGELRITVADDGRGGLAPRAGGRGLVNLEARAARHGGTCSFSSAEGGTTVVWTALLT